MAHKIKSLQKSKAMCDINGFDMEGDIEKILDRYDTMIVDVKKVNRAQN